MHKLNFKSIVSTVLIASLVCPAHLFASTPAQSKTTIAIVPVEHTDNLLLNQINQELSSSLRNNLKESFNVLDSDSVNRILKNNFNDTKQTTVREEHVPYIKLINEGKTAYGRDKNSEEALKKLDKATQGLLKNVEYSKKSSELITSARFYKSWVLFQAGKKEESGQLLREIFISDKTFDFSVSKFGDDFSEFVTAAKNDIKYDSKITVENVLPANVDVSLNNVFVGTSPMTIAVPNGVWNVSLSADNRKTLNKKVSLSAGKPFILSNASLSWSREKNKSASENNLSSSGEILSLATALGNIAKVQKVIFIDVASAGGKYTPSAQIVDPAYNQVYKPIEYRAVADLKKSAFNIVEFFGSKLKSLLSNDSLDLYKENFDKSLIIDPRMDALKDKKPLTKKPAFWVGVGAVVAAGIITGILVSGKNSDPAGDGTGSVTIGFDDFRFGR